MILLMDELLRHRRHFYANIAKSHAAGPFTDIDFVIARFLQSRLNIPSVHVDDPSIFALFQKPEEPSDVGVSSSTTGPAISPFTALQLVCPCAQAGERKLPAMTAPTHLTMIYGWQGPLGADSLRLILDPAVISPDQAVLPLFGMAPGLWRAASLLIFPNIHRPVVMDAIRQLLATFSSDDLDCLQLAERNLELREALDHISDTGAHQVELKNLRALVTTMEAEIVALRRTAVQQERNLAMREK